MNSPDNNPLIPSAEPFIQYVDGFPIPGLYSADCFRSALKYQPRPDDIFLATYPKCGTTWAQHILLLIFSHGKPIANILQFFAATPYLELAGPDPVVKMPRPGAIKVHLPFHLTPHSDQAKYIYISRNPKDCCVSYFHHFRNLPAHSFNGTFAEFFEFFVSGKIDYGDYFDHLMGWYAHRSRMSSQEENKVLPFYQDTDYGFNICGSFDMNAFKSALTYEPRPDDLFIVTYPKCGTTWVQNIVACIYREGKPFESALEFLSNTPFLELAGAEAAKTMKRPGAIKLHLPFHLTPWSSKAKYIFIARNPKDCCVSFFHHTRNIIGYKFKTGSFDDYFELFMGGKVDFGDYFDTLISWYEHRNDPNVLFLTYEELKKDTRKNVLKIAEFMGETYKDMLNNDEKILEDVIKHSSFDFMKQSLNRQMAELATLPRDFVLNHPDIPQGIKTLLTAGDGFFDSDPNSITFVRKGIVGDYKNHLSPEQNERLEKKFMERTKGTSIPELWKDVMNIPDTNPFTPSSKPFSQIVDGFQIPGMFLVDNYRSALGYKPRPDDVFIVTYPKCGTTWAQNILVLVFRHGEPITNTLKFYAAAPYLEMTGAAGGEKMPRPGAIKVHLPFKLTPWSDQAKYIYIGRNPKDCCVSYFYHIRNLPGHAFNGSFDEFFELFISGNTDYGDYFDHLLGWYVHRNDPNVLFLTYEQMKEDPEAAILKMASFIDDKLYAEPLRSDPEKLKNVVQYSSFKYMKEVFNKGMDDIYQMSKEDILNSDLPSEMKKMFTSLPRAEMTPGAEIPRKVDFVRKGIIGDWRNHFTEDQRKRLDEKFAERAKGTDLLDLWKKYT